MINVCPHCRSQGIESSTPRPSPLKIHMRETCEKCSTDLHVCINCQFYDETVHHECRESQAEYIKNKERNNLCDYFRLLTVTEEQGKSSKASTFSALDELFKK